MWDEIELSRYVKVARRPPATSELEALRARGIRAILDLRTALEAGGDALSPEIEREKAAAHGIAYVQVPVSEQNIDFATLDRVGEALERAPKPVIVHDAEGRRAGMTALVQTCIESGVPGIEMLAMARNLDLLFGTPEQQHIFASYVDMRQQRDSGGVRRSVAARPGEQVAPLLPEDVRTLRNEIREDHHRERALDEGAALKAPRRPTPRVRVVQVPSARAPVQPSPRPAPPLPPAGPVDGASALGTPLGLAAGAAFLGTVLFFLDRRLLMLLTLAGAAAAGRFAALRMRAAEVAAPLGPATKTKPDRELAELRERVQRLAARA